MLHSEMILPVVGEGLVEGSILLLGNVLRVTRPDGLGLVELFLFGALRGEVGARRISF
jgi:hypothetical protein